MGDDRGGAVLSGEGPLPRPARGVLGETWSVLSETVNGFIADNALSRGAAISYYTSLSLGPVLVICIAIAAIFFGEDAARGAVVGPLGRLMGEQGAAVIQSTIRSAGASRSGLWASLIGAGTLLITASGVVSEVQSALNDIWKSEPGGGVLAHLRARLAGLLLMLVMGALIGASLVLSAVLHVVGTHLNLYGASGVALLHYVNSIVSFVLVAVMLAATYRILPHRELYWRDVVVGALVTAVLFALGKAAIGLYIGRSPLLSSYGAASALAVVLVWIYYSAQIFLFGAEFTKVWASRRRHVPVPSPALAEIEAARARPVGVFEVAGLFSVLRRAVLRR